MHLLIMCGQQMRLYLLMLRSISSKQLNSLTTIEILSWFGGAEVTHPSLVRDIPGSIPGMARLFMFDFFVFYVFVIKHFICHKKIAFFALFI